MFAYTKKMGKDYHPSPTQIAKISLRLLQPDGHRSNHKPCKVCAVEFSAPCDRCGKNATKNHGINIKRVLVSQLADKTDDEIIEVPDLQLDVSELAVTEIVLSLPMKHLCKEDCKGICQTCGKDLNDGPCDCNHAQVDPRLEVLAQLLKD